jgi:RHS repeat-associated protein
MNFVGKYLLLLLLFLPAGAFSAAAAPLIPTNPSPGTTTSPGPVLSSRTVTLSWSPASGATSYGVAVRDLVTNLLVVDTTTSNTSFTVTLSAGKPYRWNVNACNSTGCSNFTTALHFQTPGSGPTISGYSWNPTTPVASQNFGGTVNGTGFVLGGTQVFFCINGSSTCFQHPASGVNVINSTTLTVSNVNLGAGSYQVLVQTSAGPSARSTPFSVVTISIPPIPTNTSPGTTTSPGPVLSSSTVTLSWSASSGATSYGVAVRDLVTNLLVVDSSTSNTSVPVALSPNKPYRWNVNACNSAGCSNFTAVLNFQTPGVIPPIPTNTSPGTTASPGPVLSSSTVTLSWSASSGATSYGVAVRDLVTNLLVVDSSVSNTSVAVALSFGKPYRWNVNACNSTGCSNFTTALHFQTPGSGPTISGYSWNPSTPVASQNFGGTVNGTGFIVGSTQVFFCVNGSSTCFQHPSSGVNVINSTTLTVSNVNLGAGSYQVLVQTSAGPSARSTPFSVVTISIPPIPTNTSPGTTTSPGPVLSSSIVTLSWNASAGATTYGVAVRDLVTNLLVVDSSTTNTAVPVALSPNKPYRWNVNACNSAGCSNFTTVLHFQTPAAAPPVISSVLPNSIPPSSLNQLITINGSNFLNGASLIFDPPSGPNIASTASKLTIVSSSQINYQVNNGNDIGTWQVRVINPDGQGSGWASFNVTGLGTPTVSSANWNTTPTHLQNFSGVINGTNFIIGATRVFFCVNATSTCFEHPPSGVIVTNTNSLSVSNVNLGSGSYQVFVQTASGASNRSSAFAVQSVPAQPALAVTPNSGSLGTTFRFTGTNFTRSSAGTLNVTRPNGSSFSGGRYATDSNGSVAFNLTSQSSDLTGAWTFRFVDDSGKQASAAAQYTSSIPSGTDAMIFIADVTIPDNSQLTGGTSFTKSWQLKNVGTTTWSGYSVGFVTSPTNGNPSLNMSPNGATSFAISSTGPNQFVTVSIQMKAPSPGTYYSYWQLRNANGTPFGIQFYVKIRVVPQQGNALGFGTQSGRGGTNDSVPATSGRNADPVNTATGNYNYEADDLRIAGRGLDVEFNRSYNSQDSTLGPLGKGWSHTFNIFLTDITPGSASLHYSDGKVLAYVNEAGTGNFKSSYPGYYDVLVRNSDGTWTLRKPDQRNYQFDDSGRLVRIEDRNNNRILLTYSGGNLAKVTDTVGRAFDFAYTDSLIRSVTDPIGRVLRFTYDGASNLTSFQDARGNFNSYEYDAFSRVTRIVDGRQNNLLTNTYGAANRVATQTNGRGNQWTFSYNSDGSTTVVDPLNAPTRYLHDTNFNMGRTVDRNSNSLNVLYDESNNRAQISDLNNNYSSFLYDIRGNVTTKTDPALNSRQAAYDSNNNPTQLTDETGSQTRMSYDAKGNLTSLTDTLNNSASMTYDQFGQPLTVTDANGNITTRTYDANGNLTSVKDVLNNVTTYTYDAAGRRISMTDARSNTTRYSYDANDNLLTVTDPLGNVITYTYDANNNRVSMRDARGNVTSYQYDENNLLIKETDAMGNFIDHTYDKLDRRISSRDKRGNLTRFTYDNEGRLLTSTDPLNNVSRYTYDANGNRTQVTDAKGQNTQFTYDALNRITKIEDALGNTIQKQYDAAGRLQKEIDPQGNTTQFSYDVVGNLTQVNDAAGGTARYAYDKNRNRITQTDPNNHTSNLAYDKLNRLISTSNPLNHVYSYTYDAAGNRATQTDARGQIIRYAYDGNNRLRTITYPDNSTVQLSYDANGNISQMIDGVGTSNYSYDELNRLLSVTDPFGKTISYLYDPIGNISRLTYPDGKQVNYQYDANNRLNSFTDWTGGVTSYEYDATNLLTRVTNANGVITTFGYDSVGRLTSKSDSGISSFNFTLDRNGNRTNVNVTQPFANTVQNLTHNYTYDAANRIQSAGPATFAFDSNGNMTTKSDSGGTTTYTYDFENRLKTVSGGTDYSYNGQGVRLQKIENGKTTRYVVDANHNLSQVLCETDGNGTITAYYVYGAGLAYKVNPDGTHYYYAFDPLGSTIAMTDDAKNVVNSYAYDPYGRVTNSMEATPNPFQYVGQRGVIVDVNGLLYMRARYYAPEFGRFLTKDVVTGRLNDSQTLDTYSYANNNPTLHVDPSGALVFSIGIQGQAAWSIGVNGQHAIVADDLGNHGLASSFGLIGGWVFGLSIGGMVSVTNDRSIDDLNGRSYSLDFGGGVLEHVNGSVLLGEHGEVKGVGIGVGLGVDFSAGVTASWGTVTRLSRFEYTMLLIQVGPAAAAPLLAFDASVALRNYYSGLIQDAINQRSVRTSTQEIVPFQPRGPAVGPQNPIGRPTKN